MTVTVIGDFADPLSFLASQRIEQIHSLGIADVRWLAVEADRNRPVTGGLLEPALVERAQRLAMPGEAAPPADLRVPSSRAATAAYAESISDQVPDAMRRALFEALWTQGRNIADPDVIRSIVFQVLNPTSPSDDIEARIAANLPLVPLGDPDLIATTRRLGLVVSMGRGPLTSTGQRRVDEWRSRWCDLGRPELPVVIAGTGQALVGESALEWLRARLPHGDAVSPDAPPGGLTSPGPHRRGEVVAS